MKFEQRFKIIGFLEKTFIDDALEIFEKKKGATLTENERDEVVTNWRNYSSNFTRMWLTYMTDDRLVSVLNKKLEIEKNRLMFNELGQSV